MSGCVPGDQVLVRVQEPTISHVEALDLCVKTAAEPEKVHQETLRVKTAAGLASADVRKE